MHLFILIKTHSANRLSSRPHQVHGSLMCRALLPPNRQTACELIVKVEGKLGCDCVLQGSGVYSTITHYLRSSVEWLCDDNSLKMFSCSFYWLISLFIVFIIIPHTLTSLQRWIFRRMCESGCEWERQREVVLGREEASFPFLH